jgi:hypothetical protein
MVHHMLPSTQVYDRYLVAPASGAKLFLPSLPYFLLKSEFLFTKFLSFSKPTTCSNKKSI